ncbi:hypothetical protein Tco_1434645, partial [Tanacetum coccineum]
MRKPHECLTYYALANGFSICFYRSSKDHVIARCGLRPEKLKDIEKGKQRKCSKYPSAGRDEHYNCLFRCYGETTTEDHYAIIRSYGKAILDSNDDSAVKLGLIKAVKDVVPLTEHRQCARHIYEGFRKQYTGVHFRELFLAALKAMKHSELMSNREPAMATCRTSVEMTCHNCYVKGHNKSSCTKPTIIPPTKQTGKKGRPKKNVENVESGCDATFNIDESTSQVRQGGDGIGANMESGGDATSTNVESLGVKTSANVELGGDATGTNVDSIGVETSVGNETVRSASLGDF